MLKKIIILTILIFLCVQPIVAKDTWKELDKTGNLSEVPASILPSWNGWTSEVNQWGLETRTQEKDDGRQFKVAMSYVRPSEKRVKFQSGNQFGYLDLRGNVIIKPLYRDAKEFHNGLAVVQSVDSNGWRIIDKSGQVKYKVPDNLRPDTSIRFPGVSKEGLLPVELQNHEGGIYDLVNNKYYKVGSYLTLNEPSEGLLQFHQAKTSESGFINTTGQIVIPEKFAWTSDFHEGLAAVIENDHWGYIDHSGKMVITLPKDCSFAEPFSEGLAAIALGGDEKTKEFLRVSSGAKWGFIDTNGKLVIPAIYYSNSMQPFNFDHPTFKDGLAAVAIGSDTDYKFGYIDKTGKWVIHPQFKSASKFDKGKARVCIGLTGFDPEKWNNQTSRYIHRSDQFDLFVKQNGLINMSRKQINQLLGKPDHRYLESDIYSLNTSGCAHGSDSVEIYYENDIAKKYKHLGWEKKFQWIDKPGIIQKW